MVTEEVTSDIVSQFRQSAVLYAQLPAVIAEETTLSYAELDCRSDKVASHLKAQGLGREMVVGFLLNRSAAVPAGFLGILKAGAAYLPLDVENAPERLRYVVEHAGISALLTYEPLTARGRQLCPNVPILTIEDAYSREGIAPSASIKLDDLAVLLYTSGSTGQPKGVELTHRSVRAYFQSLQERVRLEPGDISFGSIAFSFDMSIQEILLPLLHGGAYRLLQREVTCDGMLLGPILNSGKRAFLSTTPATLKLLWEAQWEGAPQLTIISGGETLHPSLVHFIHARCHSLFNIYGPTEVTVAVTLHSVSGRESRVPLGKALPQCELYILDEERRPCAPGVHGELYVGGIQVGRGYRHRPDLTEQRFVMLGLPDGRQVRTYRSGDLASWDEDGSVHFHGRCDNQVKVRGYRIELEEIELTLAKHPNILEVIAGVRSFGTNDDRLVVFFTSQTEPAPTAGDLRRFAALTLPSYMVPTHFVFKSELPKNVHKKIDRRALNAEPLQFDSITTSADGVENGESGCGPTEERLLGIWRTMLGLHGCSVTDSYFELGGHSLLAARLFQQIRREFGIQLPVSTLLTAPTVRSVAAIIDAGATARPWSPLVSIRASGTAAPIFLVHALGGNLLCFEQLIRSLPSDHPIYGLQASGVSANICPHDSIEEMAAEYTAAASQGCLSGPIILVGYSAGGVVILEMARELIAMGRHVPAIVILDSALNESGEMFEVAPFHPILASMMAAKRKLLTRGVSKTSPETSGHTAGEGGSDWMNLMRSLLGGSDWMNPMRSLLMEMRLIARKTPVLRRLVPNRFPDSFVAALRRYRAQPLAQPCKALLFCAVDQERPGRTDSNLGWGRILPDLVTYPLQRDHWTMMTGSSVEEIAATIERHVLGSPTYRSTATPTG